MNATCTFDGEDLDLAVEPPLEAFVLLDDAAHSWNPTEPDEDDEPVTDLGLLGFDISDLQPEEIDFLLVSLGAVASPDVAR